MSRDMEKGGDDVKPGDSAWILQWFYKRIRSSGIASREGEGKALSVKSAHRVAKEPENSESCEVRDKSPP